MKYFVCSIKGMISAEQCFKCFEAQDKELRLASRVLCKEKTLISTSCFAEKFGRPEAGCNKCVSPEVRDMCEAKTAELAVNAESAATAALTVLAGPSDSVYGGNKKGKRADVILELLKDGGKTQQELAKLMNIKVSTCWVALKAMQNKKLIAREKKDTGGKKVQFIYTIVGTI